MPDEIIADARAMSVEIRNRQDEEMDLYEKAATTARLLNDFLILADRVLAEAGSLRRRSDGSFCPPRTG
jgi:hypothetical protein